MNLEKLIEFEGRVLWMYLDSQRIVSTAIGRALETVEEALGLPWQVEGRAAAPAEIRQDYAAVQRGPSGYRAAWFETITRCRLPEATLREMTQREWDIYTAAFEQHYPQRGGWPPPAIDAVDDLNFNLGPGWPSAWPRLRDDLAHERWAVLDAAGGLVGGAAANCHRAAPVSAVRNAWTRDRFLEAAGRL